MVRDNKLLLDGETNPPGDWRIEKASFLLSHNSDDKYGKLPMQSLGDIWAGPLLHEINCADVTGVITLVKMSKI